MLTNIGPVIGSLLAVVILFFVVLVLVGFAMDFAEFSRELKYINCEIRRTSGEAQRKWKRERRRLWLSLLPFYWG